MNVVPLNRGLLLCLGLWLSGCGGAGGGNRPALVTAAPERETTVQPVDDPRISECSEVVGHVLHAREEGQAKLATQAHPGEAAAEMFANLESLPMRFPRVHSELSERVLKLGKASTKVLDYVDAGNRGQIVSSSEFDATLETVASAEKGLVEYCIPFLPTVD
jgi:hypothetical protein